MISGPQKNGARAPARSFSFARAEFVRKTLGILNSRHQRLPASLLTSYLNQHLAKKACFLESAGAFGTPHYFFDKPALSQAITSFRETFSSYLRSLRIFYAMKSNSFPGIYRQVQENGLGLDVSSGAELKKALDTGCARIIFSGPGKTSDELRLALKHRERVTILMDSRGEYRRLVDLVGNPKPGKEIVAGLRLSAAPQGEWCKFGVPFAEAAGILATAAKTKKITIAGLQFHQSWNLNCSTQVDMIHRIGAFVKQLPPSLTRPLRFLDIGGGFWPEAGEWLNPENTLKGKLLQLIEPSRPFKTVFYIRKAKPLSHFARSLATAILKQGPPISTAEIWTEPGRWLSNSTMHILLTVVDVKGGKVAITDGGTNMLGWERPLTEFIPLINLTRPSLICRRFPVYGSLCTPLDIWGNHIFGEEVLPGDVLLVPDQGAYTYSLRQSFIKPVPDVIQYDGNFLRRA